MGNNVRTYVYNRNVVEALEQKEPRPRLQLFDRRATIETQEKFRWSPVARLLGNPS
jgi:hypothetical protein